MRTNKKECARGESREQNRAYLLTFTLDNQATLTHHKQQRMESKGNRSKVSAEGGKEGEKRERGMIPPTVHNFVIVN